MIRLRVISALCIAVLLLVAVLLLPPFWSAAALSLILLAACWEWSGFVGTGVVTRSVFIAVVVALGAILWRVSAAPDALRALLWAGLLFWCLALLWVFWLPRLVSRSTVVLAGLIALPLAWLSLVRMRLDLPSGSHLVLYALLIVWLADSGAFFAGRAWGHRKLAPEVSPGKTWAGLWGGLAACVALALLVAWWQHLPWLQLVAVTLVIGVFSVVGDLTESLCKRFAGLKDSGSLIPGHGGVLDRFDSLLAAAPLLLLGVQLLPGLQG